jgi:acyl carrier protein
MTKQYEEQEIFDIVVKHLTATVDDIDPASVEREHSMKDLGANSLDIVEVVSCSMRELRVRVPRSELAKLKNIGGLTALLHRVLEEKAAQASA